MDVGSDIYPGSPGVRFAIPAFHVSAFGEQVDKSCLTALDRSLVEEKETDVCVYAPEFPSQNTLNELLPTVHLCTIYSS